MSFLEMNSLLHPLGVVSEMGVYFEPEERVRKIKKAFRLYNEDKDQVELERYNHKRSDIFGFIASALHAKKFEKLVEVYGFLLSKSVLELPHPSIPHIMTRAVTSISLGSENYIFFANSDFTKHWVYMQRIYMIDAIILPKKIYSVMQSAYGHSARNNMKSVLALLDKNHTYDYNSARFDGVRAGHSRPHHFFYDQMRVLNVLINKQYLAADKSLYIERSFYDIGMFARPYQKTEESRGVCIRPIVYSAIAIPPRKSEWSKDTMEKIEKLVYENAISKKKILVLPDVDLKIWIGVTGQKRSWIEQIEGYANIVNQFRASGYTVALVIDGMTAPHEETIESPEDQYVADKILGLLDSDVHVTNLIGKDYTAKIQVCQEVDVFIANGGTGCMVPLRFCKKSGVVHSNTQLLFPFDDVYERVKIINQKDIVVDQKTGDSPEQAMMISYHIQWEFVFNALLSVMPEDKKTRCNLLRVTQSRDFDQVDTITAFKRTANQMVSQKFLVKPDRFLHVLKEFASAFSSLGHPDVAQELIIFALSKNYSSKDLKYLAGEYKKQISSPQKICLDSNEEKIMWMLSIIHLRSQLSKKDIKIKPERLADVLSLIAEAMDGIGQVEVSGKIKYICGEFFQGE